MNGKVNVSIRGKSELTKKRHLVNILLKKAMKGGRQAKDRLQKEFGIRVYSSEEIGNYVKERLKAEVVEDSPSRAGTKSGAKIISKVKNRRISKKR
jgi:hypothetical protein